MDRILLIFGISVFGAFFLVQARGPYDWLGYDKFDEIDDKMNDINPLNCKSKPVRDLRLPKEVLAQEPRFNKLLSTIIYPNRTDLLHLHNMALNRAFFFSYIMQKLNESEAFHSQPGLMYYYFSTSADISANEYNINGSAVYFDNNCSYANWYRNLRFNDTLPLFGPGAFRLDDYNDPTNWLREPTNETVDIKDYGAGGQSNYSHSSYKTNQWYDLYLPDGWDKKGLDSVRKHTYDVGIKYSNETGKWVDDEFKGKTFFGPPSPGQKEAEHLPVLFTQPYYDCGRSNKWIVSAVSPVVDRLPRYLDWFHLRRHKFVAAIVMDIDWLNIDINPCRISIGNEKPNYFAGTDRCKLNTTMCEPLHGWGFRRGGYQCVCLPGFRYPDYQRGPWQGIEIESATEDEYKRGFDCVSVELRVVIPVIRGNDSIGTPSYTPVRKKRDLLDVLKEHPIKLPSHPPKIHASDIPALPRLTDISRWRKRKMRHQFMRALGLVPVKQIDKDTKETIYKYVLPKKYTAKPKPETPKRKFVPRYTHDIVKKRRKRSAFDREAHERMMDIIRRKESVNTENCASKPPEALELPGDVSYGVEKQFSNQARTALRLSHFLSNFLQNIDIYEEYGNLRGDKLLNEELLFGEALANVMGDLFIKGSGIFYDIDKYKEPTGKTRQFFGPYAYRSEREDVDNPGDRVQTSFKAIDYAGFPTHYLDKPWFKNVKERWQSNTYGLTRFTEKPMIRSDLRGTSLKRFELYPMYYRAPKEEDGWWSAPYFDCNGYVNAWIITYSVPFFGLNSIGTAIEFKGVVVVDVKLDELDVNQCPMDFHVANAFKSTARCHYESTFCESLPGKKFVRGGYKCECKQGYEYPFNDRAWYFDGQTMEEEYRKMVECERNPNNCQPSRFETLRCRIAGAAHARVSAILTVLTFMLSRFLT